MPQCAGEQRRPGAARPCRLIDATEDSFEEVLRTNLQGPYFLTQAIARDMLERARADTAFRAAIVFITSVSAEMASINRGDYCVSKAGLAMAARVSSPFGSRPTASLFTMSVQASSRRT